MTALSGGSPPALAHAALTDSDPDRGAVVREAPRQITLTFSEGIALSDDTIQVLDPRGDRVDLGEPRTPGGEGGTEYRYRVPLRPGLPNGTYTVAWRAVSTDSHPVSGAYTFSVGTPSPTVAAPPRSPTGDGVVSALYGTARYLAYGSFALLVGGGAFVLVCWPRAATLRPARRLVRGGLAGLTVTTLALFTLRGSYTGSGRLSDVLDLAGAREVLATTSGTALVVRLSLLVAAAIVVRLLFGPYARAVDAETPGETTLVGQRVPAGQRGLSLGLALAGVAVALGLGSTWSAVGHASTGARPELTLPIDLLHLMTVAVWWGGLATLALLLGYGPPLPATVVRRFSRVALGSVTVLAATGLYQSWRHVGSWSALASTTFGQLLLVKLGLIALVVVLASRSRRRTAQLTERPAVPQDAEGHVSDAPVDAVSMVPPPLTSTDAAPHPTGEHGPFDGPLATPRTGVAAESHQRTDLTGGQPPVTPPRPVAGQAHGGPAKAPATRPVRAAQLARQRDAVLAAQRRRRRDADPVRRGLRRSVLAEVGVAMAILAVTTPLTATEPGRTEQARAQERADGSQRAPVTTRTRVPFDTRGPAGRGTARLELVPGRAGAHTLHLRTETLSGRPLPVREVRAALTLEARRVGPLRVPLKRAGRGHWTASAVRLTMPGNWRISLTIRTSDIDQVTETATLKIG